MNNDKIARLAGLLYLILLPTLGIAFGAGQFLMGDTAVATVTNIQAKRSFFELAIFLGAVGFIDYLLLAMLLYRLFRPANPTAASLLLAFVAMSVPLSLAALAQRMDILLLLDGAQGLPAVGSDAGRMQLLRSLHTSNNLMLVSAIFWGLWLIPLGWAVFRSGFIPRAFGLLLIVGSVFYVCAFVGPVFDTSYAGTATSRMIAVFSAIPAVLGELGTALWLLIMGTMNTSESARLRSGRC